MACHLALDRGLAEATLLAKTYVTSAIANAYPIGKGTGPVHHLYRMYQQRRAAGSGREQKSPRAIFEGTVRQGMVGRVESGDDLPVGRSLQEYPHHEGSRSAQQ